MKMYLIRIKGTELCYGNGTLRTEPTGYPLTAAKGLMTKLLKKGQVAQTFKNKRRSRRKKKPNIYPASELELVPVHMLGGKVIVEIRGED